VPSLDQVLDLDLEELILEDQFLGLKDQVQVPGRLVENPPCVVFVVTDEGSNFSPDTYSQQQPDFQNFIDNYSSDLTSANSISQTSQYNSFQGYGSNGWLEESQNIQSLFVGSSESDSVDDLLSSLIPESSGIEDELKTPADILQEIYLEANEIEVMNGQRSSTPVEEMSSGGSATPASSYDSEMMDSIQSFDASELVVDGIQVSKVSMGQFVFEVTGDQVQIKDANGKYHQISGNKSMRPSPVTKRAGRWRGPGGSMLDAKERKRLQNREAAARYRVKKQQEKVVVVDVLEVEEVRNAELKKKVGELSQEIAYLRDLMNQIQKRQK